MGKAWHWVSLEQQYRQGVATEHGCAQWVLFWHQVRSSKTTKGGTGRLLRRNTGKERLLNMDAHNGSCFLNRQTRRGTGCLLNSNADKGWLLNKDARNG